MGLDPARLTLRKLVAMAEGRGRYQWEQTALLAALIRNGYLEARRRRPYMPDQFNPYKQTGRARNGLRLTKDNIHVLKAALPKRKK